MDQWGRPEFRDWAAVAQSVDSISDNYNKSVQRERNEKVLAYENKLTNGELKPDFEPGKDVPKEDALWAEQARASYVSRMKSTEEAQVAIQKKRQEKADLGYQKFKSAQVQAARLFQADKKDQALPILADAVNAANGPHTASVNNGKVDLYITENGEKKKLRSLDADEAFTEINKIDQNKYYMYSIANDELSAQSNTEAMLNPTVLKNDKGEELQLVVQHDPETRRNRRVIYNKDGSLHVDKKGNQVSYEEVFKQGYKKLDKKEERADKKANLDAQQTQAEIDYKEAATAKIKEGDAAKKPSVAEINQKNETNLSHLLGWAQESNIGLAKDMNGNVSGQVTAAQLAELRSQAGKLGFKVYAPEGEMVDKKGWFTGDEQMYDITGIVANGQGQQQGDDPVSSFFSKYGPQNQQQGQQGNANQTVKQAAEKKQSGQTRIKRTPKAMESLDKNKKEQESKKKQEETEDVETVFESDDKKIGRGKYGYMIDDGDGWRKPTRKEQLEIRLQAMSGKFSSSKSVDWKSWGRNAPKDGYYNNSQNRNTSGR